MSVPNVQQNNNLYLHAQAPSVEKAHKVTVRFPEDTSSIPNEQTRRVVVYAPELSFSDELRDLKEVIKEEDYCTAYRLSEQLFELYLTKLVYEEQVKVIALFEKIAKKGVGVIGKDFYAFLRAAITADVEGTEPHNSEDVIAGYKEAAKFGNADAMYYLGTYLARLERYEEAFEQFLECAKQFPNHKGALKELGVYYEYGVANNSPDLEKAESYYRRATELGCAHSPCNLALMFETNFAGDDEKRKEVIVLYTLAKSRGFSDAAYNLAVIHQTGWHRTLEGGKKEYLEQLVNYDEAEINFRLAYEADASDVNAAAVAEIIFDNKSRLTEGRWDEMQRLLKQIQAHKSDEADLLIEKIKETGPVHFGPFADLMLLADAAQDNVERGQHFKRVETLNNLALLELQKK